MNETKQNEANPTQMFLSYSAKDRALLDRVIHGGSSKEMSVVNAIRLRRFLENREYSRWTVGGAQLTLDFFDPPHHGTTVAVDGFDENDRLLADSEALNPSSVSRIVGQPIPDFAKSIRPPMDISGILSIFMPRQNRESFVGDLEEKYALIVQRKGRRSATRWFFGEVARSLLSLGLETMKRVSGVDKVIARYRRIGS